MVSSGATRPARAPPSIDMLQTVMRSSMASARMALPVYSNTLPVPPPMPILRDQREDDVLGRDAGLQRAIHAHLEGFRLALQQALRGQHVLHFAGADAEGQRAERAVRGGVAVAADHRHAGLREAQFRADHVHDALPSLCIPRQRMPNSAQFVSSCASCLAAIGSTMGSERSRGRDAVVGGGDGQVGPADFQAALAQALERPAAK